MKVLIISICISFVMAGCNLAQNTEPPTRNEAVDMVEDIRTDLNVAKDMAKDTGITPPVDMEKDDGQQDMNTGQPGAFAHVAVGDDFICALDPQGALYCWGANDQGQLGSVELKQAMVPTLIDKTLRFKTLTAGPHHICALNEMGLAFCWGDNTSQQSGLKEDKILVPSVVSDIQFSQLLTGETHTCGLGKDAAIYCWGKPFSSNNHVSKLAEEGCDSFSCPPTTFESISIGHGENEATQVCGINEKGQVYCWRMGQDRPGYTAQDRRYFFTGANLKTLIQGRGSDYFCALNKDGKLACWGDGQAGQLGTGNEKDLKFEDLSGASIPLQLKDVQVGLNNICAIDVTGVLYCWGQGQTGMLGTGQFEDQNRPIQLQLNDTIKQISMSKTRACAITQKQQLHCWGLRDVYSLGNKLTGYQGEPKPIESSSRFKQVVTSLHHVCGLTDQNIVECWGNASSCGLGFVRTNEAVKPQVIKLPSKAIDLVSTNDSSCALLDDKSVWCWGNNQNGAVGVEAPDCFPEPKQIISDVMELAASPNAVCVLNDTKKMHCWGRAPWMSCNNKQQCNKPEYLDLNKPIHDIAVGNLHFCGKLESSSGLYCRGENSHGQLGFDLYEKNVYAGGFEAAKAPTLYLGHAISYAIDEQTLWSWGSNEKGQRIGDDTMLKRGKAQSVSLGVNNIPIHLSTRPFTSCLLVADASKNIKDDNMLCQGIASLNIPGQDALLSQDKLTQIKTPALLKLSLGRDFGCGVTVKSEIVCWGQHGFGRLGQGQTSFASTPERIELPLTP